MKKSDVKKFIKEMGKIGDDWTEDQVEDVFGDKDLDDALDERKSQVGMHLNNIVKALFSTNKEDDE